MGGGGGANLGMTGQNEIFQHFLSYFIKRGKILLNSYFIPVDYIEFLSAITPLPPSLGIE